MKISDLIEEFIKDLFEEGDELIEIQRNDLAEHFNCVPSQINYVIATRFTPNHGYYVESKRGGGGSIKIKRLNIAKSDYLMHIISNIGDKITDNECTILINNFFSLGIISKKEAKLLKVVTNNNVLNIENEKRDYLRANILKNVLLNIVEE